MTRAQKQAEKAIRKLDVQWGQAATKKDLAATLAFYATDGSLVWPGAPAAHGTRAIRAAWVGMMKTPGLGLRFTPERIVVSDEADLASDFGKVRMTQQTARGKQTMVAKYLVVWRKEGGAWKVLYDSYNLNSGQ
jgi:uncharacterized protein (TIGR02246 family)